jgi:hypothetical protein
MATKYLTYTFPIMFPFAVFAALFIEERLVRDDRPMRRWILLLPVIGLILIFIAAGYYILSGLPVMVYLVCQSGLCIGILWCFGRKEIQFKWAFLTIILTYLIFTASVLAPFAVTKSGKNFAREFSAYRDYQIGTYRFYSTSAVYYSGKLLNMIVTPPEVQKYRNSSFTWYSKYTMPVYTVAEFKALPGRKKIIIVLESMQNEFLKDARKLRPEKLDQEGDRLYFIVK